MSDPSNAELARRLERLESKLNGRYVSGEVFNIIVNDLRESHQEHLEQHKEDRGAVRSFRYMVAGAIIAAVLSLLVSLALLVVSGGAP